MPVEFLTDDGAAAFGRYAGPPTRAELDRMFYLDDADLKLIAKRRGDHMRLGFALQLATVRYLGTFLTDPLDVPSLVTEHLAGQLRIADPSCVKRYTERRTTPLEHRDEIKAAGGLREFSETEDEFERWVRARAWSTGDGPKTIFNDGVKWLRANAVLLPGVTTITRLVSRVRRIVDLARHGMTARAQALRRHGDPRKLATLVATVAYLEARSVDDCLELLDLLVTTELVGKAESATDKERARRHPDLARHSSRLAAAVQVLLEVTDSGGEITLSQVWESIDAVVPRRQLRESVDAVADLVPPPGLDADAEMRARLTERIAMVTPFLKILTEVITFGATPEGEAALAAMRALPRLRREYARKGPS